MGDKAEVPSGLNAFEDATSDCVVLGSVLRVAAGARGISSETSLDHIGQFLSCVDCVKL